MTDSTLASLAQAQVMTRQMLDLAKQDNWDEVIEVEAKRQQAIQKSLDESTPVDPSSPVGQQIQEILKIDQEIQALATEAKNSIRDELVEINKIRNQAKAYQGK